MRTLTTSRIAALSIAAAATALTMAASPVPHDPFAFFAPSVNVSSEDREHLDNDGVIARTLPGEDAQLSLFVATRLDAQPDALAAWMRAIAELKRSRFVLAIGRFSSPPMASDADELALDPSDLSDIRKCVPGDCGLKLSAPEIGALRAAAARGGDRWREAVQAEFRRLLVERVNTYQATGLPGLPPSVDSNTPRRPDDGFAALVASSPYLTRVPGITAWLKEYPNPTSAHVESFFYWSKEYYGSGKPVISITHVGIVRPGGPDVPAVVVAGKQIFATHYLNAALGLTMVMRDGKSPYLVYLNRSELDLLKGFFGPMARRIVESRLRHHAPQIVGGLRARLESGAPPELAVSER